MVSLGHNELTQPRDSVVVNARYIPMNMHFGGGCRWLLYHRLWLIHHYNDVIMGTTASQITSLTIVYSTVCSGADQRKHQSSASLAFVRGIHRGPVNSQMASNAENVSIWWRHHMRSIFSYSSQFLSSLALEQSKIMYKCGGGWELILLDMCK